MPVSNVAASAPATSAWANSVADSVDELESGLFPTTYGQVEIPWTAISGEPATFPPTLGVAVEAETSYGLSAAVGASAAAAKADHKHGTPALPNATQVGAVAAYDSPATTDGGKRLYVGSATPTGMVEGDVWIKG